MPINKHEPCGHWHLKYTPTYHFVCPPLSVSWHTLRTDTVRNALFAAAEYDQGSLIVMCELTKFYNDHYRYVAADYELYTDPLHPLAERAIKPVLVLDPDTGFGYCFCQIKFTSNWRVFKFNLNDCSHISNTLYSGITGNKPVKGFLYVDGSGDRWLIVLDGSGGRIHKFNASTLALDSSLVVGSEDFYTGGQTYSTAFFVGLNNLYYVDLDTMSIIFQSTPPDNPGSVSDVVITGAGACLYCATVSYQFNLFTNTCLFRCQQGELAYSSLLTDKKSGASGTYCFGKEAGLTPNDLWGRFIPGCCDFFGNCTYVKHTWSADNPYTGLNYAVACKDYDPKNNAGNYGTTQGWIESLLFDSDKYGLGGTFYHEICRIEAEW